MVAGLSQYAALFQHIPTWVVWRADGAQIIARAHVSWLDVPENRHLVDYKIMVSARVSPARLGEAPLLPLIAETTRRENRHTLFTDTNERVPAGAEFMERLGACKGSWICIQINSRLSS